MHTWRRPELPPREISACEGAAAGERLTSIGSGGRLPSNSGKAASDTGRGTADIDSVPPRCSSWGKFEGTLDEMRRNEVPRKPGPRRPEALYKDDDA